MQPLQSPSPPEIPRAAASLILLRDSPEGLQTLLVRRHSQMVNMAGVCVFPGGKLDSADSDCDTCLDQSPAALHQALGEPDVPIPQAAALYVAALREALEECGLLLAQSNSPDARIDAPRARALLRAGEPFAAVLATLQLTLTTQHMQPWSRWITPVVPSRATRRFDTRFFVAATPQGQEAIHDDEETTASFWMTPRHALEQYQGGTVDLAPPQIMSLAQLARHADVASVLAQARSQRPPTIQPETFAQDGGRVICFPGDPMHSIPQRALPLPTRLYQQRGQCFLPQGGLPALLSHTPLDSRVDKSE